MWNVHRLAIVAEDINHAEYDEDGNFLGDSAERMVDTGVPSRRLLNSSSTSTMSSFKSSQETEPSELENDPHGSKGKGHKSWHLFPTKHHQHHHEGAHKTKKKPGVETKHSHKYAGLPWLLMSTSKLID